MLICLYGPDAHRRREKLRAITEEYTKKHSALSVQSFDLSEEYELQRFIDSVSARSLFDPLRFIKVVNASSVSAADLHHYAETLKTIVDEKEVVVALSSAESPPKALEFLLKKPVTSQEFSVLDGAKIAQLIRNEAAKRGLALTADDVNHVAGVCGGDGFCIANELEKLSLGGEAQIRQLAEAPTYKRAPFFEAVMGLRRAPDARGKLPILEALLTHEDSAAVFNMLAVLVSDTEKRQFADYDIAIKSGRLDYEAALTDYAVV